MGMWAEPKAAGSWPAALVGALVRTLARTLAGGVVLAVVGVAGLSAASAQDVRRTSMSLVGEPKFPADFKSFTWVNANAPKGGLVHLFGPGTFDSFNQFPAQGQAALNLTLVYDSLFSRDINEAATGYALIAAWASYPPDYSSVTFGLRPEARFNDGQLITVEDVIFSFEQLKKTSPLYSTYYQHVLKAEKTGPHEVKFTFDVKNNHELPQITSELPILPKHWWDGKTPSGEPRDLAKSSLELPVGSGPYRVKSFEAGRKVVYERVKDWWAANLPVGLGQYNFDEIEVDYYRERIAAFEAFKHGDIDFWPEGSAKVWATEYDFDAVRRGLVKKEVIPTRQVAPMQAFILNQRHPQFQDIRVRRALTLAFDFDWVNKNLFFGLYKRLESFFDNSELASRGLPEGRELAILNEVKAELPPEVFTTEFASVLESPPDQPRRNLAAAAKLLSEAGYVNKGGVMTSATGQPLTFEFLNDDPAIERLALAYKNSLDKLGVRMTIRTVDSAQYQRRHDDFDYDVILAQMPQSESPGNEQRDFFGSSSVDIKGSYNVAGIHNKAIDALIDHVIFATDRADLVAATHALDRALLWNFYVVPTYYRPGEWIATWDIFGRPSTLPARRVGFLQTWWIDAAKAQTVAAAKAK